MGMFRYQEVAALDDGWHLTTPEAMAADEEQDGAPTREELNAKADELGDKIVLIIGGVGIAGILLAAATIAERLPPAPPAAAAGAPRPTLLGRTGLKFSGSESRHRALLRVACLGI